MYVKIAVTTPVSHAEAIREATAVAGAGKTEKYSHASFSVRGVGRFLPLSGANPAVGRVGVPEEVEEEKIEWVCKKEDAARIASAIRAVHPYEEPVIDVYPLETL